MNYQIVGYLFLCIVGYCKAADSIYSDISIVNVDRSIDISSQVVKINSKISLQNNGNNAIGFFLYAIEPKLKQSVSYIGSSSDGGKHSLKTVQTKVQGQDKTLFWRINLRENLKPGKKILVEVEVFYTQILTPFPATILQKEKQYILYNGNLYLYSPYTIAKQTTTVVSKTKNLVNFTDTPHEQVNGNIPYGPFESIPPLSSEELTVHYENNSPFITVTNLQRILEVSHWGNVAVEETIDLEHKGAILKGSFSRSEYQRDSQSGKSSVKSFKTVLPAAAKDVYYRDEIGNISTSHLRVLSDFIELDLRPRFPIFGGWKTSYILGYNIPSYEYLYHSGNSFILKMRLLDHVYDDMVVEELTTRIILPEGVQNIKVKTPYPVQRLPNEKLRTYLDTTGRTVIILRLKNLVESHIQDVEISYSFARVLMLQEPLLAIFGFFTLFLIGIIGVRLDLSLSKPKRHAKEH